MITEVPEGIRQRRRDLHGLVVLESLQMAAAIGGLVAIAVHDIVISGDLKVSVSIASVLLLALVYVTLSVRIRAGQEALRRELCTMEHRHGIDEDPEELDLRAHPYRRGAARSQR
jgi:hypothetical protein